MDCHEPVPRPRWERHIRTLESRTPAFPSVYSHCHTDPSFPEWRQRSSAVDATLNRASYSGGPPVESLARPNDPAIGSQTEAGQAKTLRQQRRDLLAPFFSRLAFTRRVFRDHE